MAKGKKRGDDAELPSVQDHLDAFHDSVVEVSDLLAEVRELDAEHTRNNEATTHLDTGAIDHGAGHHPLHKWWKPTRQF